MIEKGQVKGLALPDTFSLTRRPSKAKEQAFKNSLTQVRRASKDYYGGKERALLSKENHAASDQYEDRAKRGELQTVTENIGKLGEETTATSHHHDKKTNENTSEAELIKDFRKNERNVLSEELAHDHEEYDKRMKAGKGVTKTDDIGHLGVQTEASKHHHDKQDADHVPEGEYIEHMRKHERELLSADLKHEHEEYDKRMKAMKKHSAHSTVAHGPSHAALSTDSSRHSNKAEEWHSQAEKDKHNMEHEREAMGEELSKAKADFQRRMQKTHSITTRTDRLGHFADATEDSSQRDISHNKEEMHKRMRNARQAIAEENRTQSDLYRKRMIKSKSGSSSPRSSRDRGAVNNGVKSPSLSGSKLSVSPATITDPKVPTSRVLSSSAPPEAPAGPLRFVPSRFAYWRKDSGGSPDKGGAKRGTTKKLIKRPSNAQMEEAKEGPQQTANISTKKEVPRSPEYIKKMSALQERAAKIAAIREAREKLKEEKLVKIRARNEAGKSGLVAANLGLGTAI